jgi:predicted DNA binding CopG/RHH family protein
MNKLDNYEKDILESFEKGEWHSIKNVKNKIKVHQLYAKNSLKKDKRINIRITAKDLEEIQRKAISEGIPYQTLIASVIHKYNTGKLIEKFK